MGVNFPTRSQTKISHSKAVVAYPRHFFVDRVVKKIKSSGTRLPTKVDIPKVYYNTSKTITTHPNYG